MTKAFYHLVLEPAADIMAIEITKRLSTKSEQFIRTYTNKNDNRSNSTWNGDVCGYMQWVPWRNGGMVNGIHKTLIIIKKRQRRSLI